MSRLLIIRPLAEADVEQAFRWYEEQSIGLGSEFVRAFDAVLAGIERQPERHPTIHKTIRRALMRRFPYGVYYVVDPERVQVIACKHQKQHPRRWQERRPH